MLQPSMGCAACRQPLAALLHAPAVNNVQRGRKAKCQSSAALNALPAVPPADDPVEGAAAAAPVAPLPPTIGELLKSRPDVVVVDEAHVIKTETVGRRALMCLRQNLQCA